MIAMNGHTQQARVAIGGGVVRMVPAVGAGVAQRYVERSERHLGRRGRGRQGTQQQSEHRQQGDRQSRQALHGNRPEHACG